MGHPLYRDDDEIVQLEARNGLLLIDEVKVLFAKPDPPQTISRAEVEQLHAVAIKDIYSCAGSCRAWDVTICGSKHKPPQHHYVEGLIDQMCEEATAHEDWDELQVSAHVLWRLNGIHPFAGGNGRTSRAACYLVLCRRLGFLLPGKLTIPEQVALNRPRYQEALEEADAAWANHILDVSKMEALLDEFLTRQLEE